MSVPTSTDTRLRTTRWSEAVAWLKARGVGVGDMIYATSRRAGRHRVGFRAVCVCYRPDESGFVRIIRSTDGVPSFEPVGHGELRDRTRDPARAGNPLTDVGRAGDLVAVSAARTQSTGSVEFRLATCPWVVSSFIQTAAVDNSQAGYLALRPVSDVGWMTVIPPNSSPGLRVLVSKVLPWIADYRLAEAMAAADVEAWLGARTEIARAPRWVRQAADLVYSAMAETTSRNTLAAMQF